MAIDFPNDLIIAHRGASGLAPEQTRPAIIIAMEMRADMIEVDLQRTKDGVLILYHDDTLDRTTNVEQLYPNRSPWNVGDFTYDELMELDAGSFFNKLHGVNCGPTYYNEKILRFDELLTLLKTRKDPPRLFLELKNPHLYPGLEEEALQSLRREGYTFDWKKKPLPHLFVAFTSFDYDSLQRMKALEPHSFLSFGVENRKTWEFGLSHAHTINALTASAPYSTPVNLKKSKALGLYTYTYQISSPLLAALYRKFGINGIFTNRPFILRNAFEKPKLLPSLEHLGEMDLCKIREALEKNAHLRKRPVD